MAIKFKMRIQAAKTPFQNGYRIVSKPLKRVLDEIEILI